MRYFLQEGKPKQGRNALYMGPRRPSGELQHHLTLEFDLETEDLDKVHLTRMKGDERWKLWSLLPDNLRPQVAQWIKDNFHTFNPPDLQCLERNYYAVSAWRVLTFLKIVGRLSAVVGWILSIPLQGLGLVRLRVREDKSRARTLVTGKVDRDRILLLLRKLRPFKRFAEAGMPVLMVRGGPRFLNLFLTSPRKMSGGDAALLIPKRTGPPALVVVKWDELLQAPADKVVEQAMVMYRQMELHEIVPDLRRLSLQVLLPFTLEVRGGLELD